jgi:uncharacterized protein involved in exopolysaccharide biosynthesis/Mrp family chromosome partitioning ATPase
MNTFPLTTPPGLTLGDVYFTLFRHKWKIVFCTLLGVASSAAVNYFNPPPFQSEAKLFVRYIISESKAFGPSSNETTAKSPDQRGETIMKSEAEILGSLDIAKQVAEAVGPERITLDPTGGKDPSAAAAQIKNNLSVYVAPASSVINITFTHSDPAIVQTVLREVIERYRRLHVETHTANGMLGDFLSQETDQLRSRLAQTEDDLRKATLKAGIVSLEDARKDYNEQLTGLRRELFEAQADLAQRTAVFEEVAKRFPPSVKAAQGPAAIAPEILAEHRNHIQQVEMLQRLEQEALTQFTPASTRVKEIRTLLVTARAARQQLEKDHPNLDAIVLATRGPEASGIDPLVVATQITAAQARIKVLTAQLEEIHREAAKVDQMEGAIVELRRKKELEDANYRYYSASLEQSRINETLGNGRVSNISQIQAPSPPFSDHSKVNKLLGMILGGGLFVGIAWAFLIELYFDRSVKRPVDLERILQVPLLLAIPELNRKQLSAAVPLALPPAAGEAPNGDPAGTARPHALQPFHETLRDRLISYFESVNLTHKPKLVAVTGLGPNAGVSTSATGLARSLSETGDGNVLLVDMNAGPGVSQQFERGQPVRGLDEFLDTRDGTPEAQKLYVVAENNHGELLSRNIPQRFSKLVPKLKASDFDYIIFDMPPISQISITPRLAAFMDMVLVVVEAEKTDRDLVQRATALLAETRAHVGVVLNKTRRYIPARLHQDSLSSS